VIKEAWDLAVILIYPASTGMGREIDFDLSSIFHLWEVFWFLARNCFSSPHV
jgi:hypothetical protein